MPKPSSTKTLPSNSSSRAELLQLACQLLQRGAVIAYPTEAVFGLGCDPLNADAVGRILELKQRPPEKGLILVAANFAQLEPFLEPLPPGRSAPAKATWPGPHTWLWPARSSVPRWLRGAHESIAVRVSAHPLVRELCLSFGSPLVSTSANRGGKEPARSAEQVRAQFREEEVDLVLPGALGASTRPTEIRDLLTGAVLRGA